MFISQLQIKNYRNFLDFKIDLRPLTLIIGENNVGKSNLLDSIGLIFSQDVSFFKKRMLEVSDFNYLTIKNFKKSILDSAIPPEDIILPVIEVEATLKDWDDDQEAVIADWFTNKECTEACLRYVFAPVANFNKVNEINAQRQFIADYKKQIGEDVFDKLLEPAKLDLLNFPISQYHYTIFGGNKTDGGANPYHLSQMKFELLDALRDAHAELVASGNRKLLFRILNARDEKEYQQLKTELVGLQESINKNKTLQAIKKGISDQLDKISLKTDQSSNEVDLVFSHPDVADILKKISIIYGDDPVKIERNGTGRNNLLFISLVLSFIEDKKRMPASFFRIVGLEEPESHLHPNLQDHLAHNIEKLIQIPDRKEFRKDVQVLLTSHSTYVSTKIDFNNTVILFKDNGIIKPHYVFEGFDETAKSKKHIQYLNKYLDAENINLFYSQKIILVEGISEKLLVPFFFNMIRHNTTEKFSCCVINVNGLAFSNFLEIVKNGYFRKCLVLTDSDVGTAAENRADKLTENYKDVEMIRIQFTKETTFEKDIIVANTTGKGRNILIAALILVRPNSGKSYKEGLADNPLDVKSFFSLIEEHKSSFAYSLLITLTENHEGFVIPEYIREGINWLV
jgi:putative ATP-dependent endonuclease of the OLD family